MTEIFLLWGKYACIALHLIATCGACLGGIIFIHALTEPRETASLRAGAWVLAVCTLFLVALPWWPVWDAWIELARRP